MFKQYLILFLLFLLLNLSFATVIPAQTKDAKAMAYTEKIKKRVNEFGIGKDVKVSVLLKTGGTVKGNISEIKENSFVVTDEKSSISTEITFFEVNQVNGKKPLSRKSRIVIGALVTTAAIFTLAILCGRYCED